MSKKNKCCCENDYESNNNGILGCGSGCTPILFLLIACGSGLLNCNKSYLIILLFLLCGGSFSKFLGAGTEAMDCCY